jgi:RND family efflux transporter MFP subunit
LERLVLFERFIAACATLSLLLVGSCSKPGSAEDQSPLGTTDSLPVVAVQKATRNNLSRSVTLTAEFTPYQEVEVMSKVAGFVKQINVDIGDRVRKGQILATLEVPEMSDDLAKAAAAVQRSDSEIQRARDELRRAQASHDIAHLSYKRLEDVFKTKPGLVAQQELDDARSKDLVGEAQMAAAQSNLDAAEQQSQESRAEQARYKTLFNYTSVTAPFDGVITMRYANTGSMIQAATSSQTQAMPIVRISENRLLRLILPVPESGVSRIHLGEPVEVHVQTLNRSFPGKIARFTERVSTATRTMDTEVDVPNPSLVLIPGMYAEVDLQLDARSNVLSIPIAALDSADNQTRVYKVGPGGIIEIVRVTVGIQTATDAEISSGLKQGDMVVVGSRAGLNAGEKVKPEVVSIYSEKASS